MDRFEQAGLRKGIIGRHGLRGCQVGRLDRHKAAARLSGRIKEGPGEFQPAGGVEFVEVCDMGGTIIQPDLEMIGLVLAREHKNHCGLLPSFQSASAFSGLDIRLSTASAIVSLPSRIMAVAAMMGASTPLSLAMRTAMAAVATPSASGLLASGSPRPSARP